jgi:hypothetical protein
MKRSEKNTGKRKVRKQRQEKEGQAMWELKKVKEKRMAGKYRRNRRGRVGIAEKKEGKGKGKAKDGWWAENKQERKSHNISNGATELGYITPQGKSHICIPFWELSGLSPNFHTHVFAIYIFSGSVHKTPHISLQQNRQFDPGNI